MSLVLATYCDDGILLAGDSALDMGKHVPLTFTGRKVHAVGDDRVLALTGMSEFRAGNDHVNLRREGLAVLQAGDARTSLSAYAAWCARVVEERCRPYLPPDRVQGIGMALASRRGGTMELLVSGTRKDGGMRANEVRVFGPRQFAFMGWPQACLTAYNLYQRATRGDVFRAVEVLDAFRTIVARVAREGHPVGGPVSAAIVTSEEIRYIKGLDA